MIKSTLKWLFGICLGLLAWPSLAQAPVEMTMQQAIDYAYDQSIAIRNARLDLLDAQQQIVEQRSTGLPSLYGDVSFQRYLKVPVQPLPEPFVLLLESLNPGEDVPSSAAFFLKNNFTAGLSLDAMIFDATYFSGLKAARAYREYVAQDLEVSKRDIRNRTIDAYLPVVLAVESIQITERNIEVLATLLEETRALYEAGFSEQLDVDRQQLALSNQQIQLDNLQRELDLSIARLKNVIGFPAEQELVPSGDLQQMVDIANEADLSREVILQARPEYLLAEKGIELNELNVQVNKSQYFPKLTGMGSYQQAYQGNDFKNGFWAPTALVGLSLNVPIFDGLYKQSQVERARIDLEQAQNQRIDLARNIRLEVESARTSYLNAREVVENQQGNMELAERIYDTSQEKYREGVGSSVELTQAEQGLFQAQSNYIQALYNLLTAKVALETALGN